MPSLSFLRQGTEVFRQSLLHETRVGRDSTCHVRLPDRAVSREHLIVRPSASGWTAWSRGGAATWLGPRRIESHDLRDGDTLTLGSWQLRFLAQGGDGADEDVTDRSGPVAGPGGQRAETSGSREPDPVPGMVGGGPAMCRVFAQVRAAAVSSLPVLLLGETGTGKERVATALHALSRRAIHPLVALNCAALTPSLLESQLFGHRRGAFTGAAVDHPGAFERAGAGTVFLDEVGELPPEAQAKLLRALETREVLPVGGTRPIPILARIVAATHRDLPRMVQEGTFRSDLLFRLWVLPIEVPPLRARPDDILRLAPRLLAEGGVPPFRLDPAALERLKAHTWPGNVRELRNVLLRATVQAEGGVIRRDDLHFLPGHERGPDAPRSPDHRLDEVERKAIRGALQACAGNRTRTARALGIARSTLHVKLRALGIGE